MSQSKGKGRSGPETTQTDAFAGSLLPQPEELYQRERLTKMQGSRELGNGFKFWDLNDDTLRKEYPRLDAARNHMCRFLVESAVAVPGSLWTIWLVGKDSAHAHPTFVVFNKDTEELRKRLAEFRDGSDYMREKQIGYLVLDKRPEHYLNLKTTAPAHPPKYTIMKEDEYGGPAFRILIPPETKDGHKRITTMGGFIEAPDGIQGKAGIYGLTISSAFEDWRIEEEKSEIQQKVRSSTISEDLTVEGSGAIARGARQPQRLPSTVDEQRRSGPANLTKRCRRDKFYGWIAIESDDHKVAQKPNIVALRDNLDGTLMNTTQVEEMRGADLWIQTAHVKAEVYSLPGVVPFETTKGYFLAVWRFVVMKSSLGTYKS